MLSTGKGTVEYGGITLSVAEVRLKDGAFLVTAAGTGDLDYAGPVSLYGPDGVLVTSEIPLGIKEAFSGSGPLRLELTVRPVPVAAACASGCLQGLA